MGDSDNELSAMMQKTGHELEMAYQLAFCEIFEDHGIGSDHEPVPLEAIRGIAQAFADASGYRVVVQQAVVRPTKTKPMQYLVVGHRDIEIADPALDSNDILEH